MEKDIGRQANVFNCKDRIKMSINLDWDMDGSEYDSVGPNQFKCAMCGGVFIK